MLEPDQPTTIPPFPKIALPNGRLTAFHRGTHAGLTHSGQLQSSNVPGNRDASRRGARRLTSGMHRLRLQALLRAVLVASLENPLSKFGPDFSVSGYG